jgi:glutamate racemase
MAKLYPDVTITGEACPMWAPLVENREYDGGGADYFVRKNIEHIFAVDPLIDTLALACTHYPMLDAKIRKCLPRDVTLFSQGAYVADSLKDYLTRHPEMSDRLTKTGNCRFMTTESVGKFAEVASIFFDITVEIEHITLK